MTNQCRPAVITTSKSRDSTFCRRFVNRGDYGIMNAMKRRAGMITGTILACCGTAFALNPSLDIDQYAHHSWTVRDGFFKGSITSIAQTVDGYLWLGTEFGVLRFDGVRAVQWQSPANENLPEGAVYSLLGTRDGHLWIGGTNGLASWKDGKVLQYPDLAGQLVGSMLEDRDGTVWAGSTSVSATLGRLCAIRAGVAQCYGQDGGLGRSITAVYEIRGELWLGTEDSGLWRWKPGPPARYAMPFGITHWQTLSEDENGEPLIATMNGFARLAGNHVEPYALPGTRRQIPANAVLRDRDGTLWIGTLGQGLLHVHKGRTDRFSRADGLSDDSVLALFEDREGNIWVATERGLDCFRNAAIPTISVRQGLIHTVAGAVQSTNDGSVWIASRGGLDRWKDGDVTHYFDHSQPRERPESIFQDDRGRIWASSFRGTFRFEDGHFVPVSSVPAGQTHWIREDNSGNLWFGHDDGVVRLSGSAAEVFPSSSMRHHGNVAAALADPTRGGLWLGFFEGGLVYFKDSQVRTSYGTADGLGKGAIGGIQIDGDGTVWAATEGGLSRVRNGRIATLTSRNGLPCDSVHWVMEDNDHAVWLYLSCGLVRIARSNLEAWAADPTRLVQTTVFDSFDGVSLHSLLVSGYGPRVTRDHDGKLWFVSGNGVSIIDPHHLALNRVPPPVQIEQITGDRRIYWRNSSGSAAANIRLPALVRDLEIDYTALSLATPEKVHFRYKLEGQDRDWKEVVNERQVQYSNLPPRHYRFRVAASNNSGVWNESGASLEFSVTPAYFQTVWFQAACAAVFLALIWGLYRYRLHRIAHQFNLRLEERVSERTRIARALHDTLLQSFQGVLLKLDAVSYLIARRPDEAMQVLEGVIGQAQSAIVEGRDAVHDLRSSATISNELAEAIKDAGDELTGDGGAAFRFTVEGAKRELRPIVRDEIYRISREALRNAFNHAKAERIEAELIYADRVLRVRIRDDGAGIPPSILKDGRSGHYGLAGMRERAAQIGGKLNIWSRGGAGTEVDLRIPGSIAYAEAQGRSRLNFLRRKAG